MPAGSTQPGLWEELLREICLKPAPETGPPAAVRLGLWGAGSSGAATLRDGCALGSGRAAKRGLHRRAPPPSFPAGQVLPQRLPQPGFFSLLFLMAPFRSDPPPAGACEHVAAVPAGGKGGQGAARARGGCAQGGLRCLGWWRRGLRVLKPTGTGGWQHPEEPHGALSPVLQRHGGDQGVKQPLGSPNPKGGSGAFGSPPGPTGAAGFPPHFGAPSPFWGSLPPFGAPSPFWGSPPT